MSFRFDLVADYSSLYLFLFLGGFIVFTAFFEWLTSAQTNDLFDGANLLFYSLFLA